MWLKMQNGDFLHMESGNRLGVHVRKQGGAEVYAAVKAAAFTMTVQDGYEDKDAAMAALDELMDGMDAVRIQPPIQPEELQPEPENAEE